MSIGVLLFEMSFQELPEMSVTGRAEQAKMVQWDPLAQIVEECITDISKDRPTIARMRGEGTCKPMLRGSV